MGQLRLNGKTYGGGGGGRSKIVYNESTDKLDVYLDGVVIGSINCQFKGYAVLTSEGWKNGFSLGSVATWENTLYTSDGACSYANYQITCAIPATNAHTRGSYINGVIPFANYSKAIATLLIDGVTEMTIELDLSGVTSNGYLAIFAHRNASGIASCGLKATRNNSGNYVELAHKGTGDISSASKVVFTDIRLIYNE